MEQTGKAATCSKLGRTEVRAENAGEMGKKVRAILAVISGLGDSVVINNIF